jgi:glycosyltransferase involved in cell wall biosynthesis
MSVLYAGIDFAAFQGERRYDPYFLIPGRIMWTKNTELGLRSFIEFKRRGPEFAHFKLIIAGFVDRKSKPYLAKLREIAAGRDDIEFCIQPADAELFDLYRNSYSVIYTPFNEDMGLIPVEAMAAGKPVLTINCGGPREKVTHGRNGFLLEENQEEFVQVMEKLAANPELVRTMGMAGQAAAGRFDWSNFHRTIDAYFDQLVARHATGDKKRGLRR